MKTVISIKKHMGSIAKAGHNKREAIRKAENKKEQDILGNLGIFRPLAELIIEIYKSIKNR